MMMTVMSRRYTNRLSLMTLREGHDRCNGASAWILREMAGGDWELQKALLQLRAVVRASASVSCCLTLMSRPSGRSKRIRGISSYKMSAVSDVSI